jgi:hypothetical protein
MKKSLKLVPAWAGEYCGRQVRSDWRDSLIMDQDIEVMEGNKDGEWLITFPTRLKCPCPMNESKGSVTLKIKAGKLAAVQTEFLAYVFRPPEVGWRASGKPCALKDDDFARELVRRGMGVEQKGNELALNKVAAKRRSSSEIAEDAMGVRP